MIDSLNNCNRDAIREIENISMFPVPPVAPKCGNLYNICFRGNALLDLWTIES